MTSSGLKSSAPGRDRLPALAANRSTVRLATMTSPVGHGLSLREGSCRHLTGRALLVPLVAMILSIVGCAKEEVGEAAPVVRPVKIFTVGSGTAAGGFEYPGTISAAQHAEMAFEVPGRVVEFPVIEGQAVEEEAVLARLDARDYEARLASAEADLNKARADHARGQRLRKEDPGAIAQVTLDTYKRSLDVAQATYQETKKALDDTILRAPFGGRVAQKLIDDFANVRAKQPVLILQDDSHLEIDFNVPERDVVWGKADVSKEEATRRVRPEVVVTSIPGRRFEARIESFTTTADPVTRTFQMTLAFDNPADVQILPGMTAKAVIARRPGERGQGLIIPAAAVLTAGGEGASVWLVAPESMTVRRTRVEVGDLTGENVLVRGGLKQGDQIAVSGVHRLKDGMQVRRFGD
jgi:RND family efflux transporter MFP subunit